MAKIPITSHTLDKQTIHRFRRVFGTPDGQAVLQEILLDANCFKQIDPNDTAAAAVKEFGLRLLWYCGAWSETNSANVVEAMFAALGVDAIMPEDVGVIV